MTYKLWGREKRKNEKSNDLIIRFRKFIFWLQLQLTATWWHFNIRHILYGLLGLLPAVLNHLFFCEIMVSISFLVHRPVILDAQWSKEPFNGLQMYVIHVNAQCQHRKAWRDSRISSSTIHPYVCWYKWWEAGIKLSFLQWGDMEGMHPTYRSDMSKSCADGVPAVMSWSPPPPHTYPSPQQYNKYEPIWTLIFLQDEMFSEARNRRSEIK